MIAAAAMTNVRRITRYMISKDHQMNKSDESHSSGDLLFLTLASAFDRFRRYLLSGKPCFSF